MRPLKIAIICVTSVAALAACVFWVLPRILFHDLLRQVNQVSDVASAQVACRDLAILCQTCREHPNWFSDEPPLAPAWTPQSVLKFEPSWVDVALGGARVEFGGGFHHFGYWLHPEDLTSADHTNTTWVLDFYSEDSQDRELCRVSLKPGDVLTKEQFVDRTMTEFDSRITGGYDTQVAGRHDAFASIQRVNFAVKHNEISKLHAAIRESARRYPDAWRDVLFAFVIDYPSDAAGAAERLRQWASGKSDFSAWLVAAYAFHKVGEIDSAEDAVLRACERPADDPAWTSSNARFRAHSMSHLLFDSGRLKTCAKLCETLLEYQSGGRHLGSYYEGLRNACRIAQTQPESNPFPGVDKTVISDSDPFGGIDMNTLRSGTTP